MLAPMTAENEVAILFGPEDRGLTNEDLRFCHSVMTIPTADFSSLNLAQAVMVLAYELFVAAAETGWAAAAGPRRASTAELEGLYSQMERVLLEIGYLHESNPRRMIVFRALFGRAGLDAREVRALRGIFRQVAWFAGRLGE